MSPKSVIGDGEFSVRVKSGDPNEIVRLWKIIQDQIVEKMDNYEAIGSTSMNECWHSLLYTTGLLNKAFRYSPIQTDIAIAISVLWFNESEEHVIREITHICDTELAKIVSTQISAVQIRKRAFVKSISGGKRRLEKIVQKEVNKKIVYEDPEQVHTPTRSPNRKKRKINNNNN